MKTKQLESIREKLEWIEKDIASRKKRKLKKALVLTIAELLALAEANKINSKIVREEARALLRKWWEERQEGKFRKVEISVHGAYKEWASFYEKMFNPLMLTEEKNIRLMLKDVKNKKILDLGCGTGRHSIFMAKKGASVVGVDFSEAMLKIAKSRARTPKSKIEFKKADITRKLPFESGTFDIVICSLVLNHIKNLLPIFKEASRILKPDGIFIFSNTHPESVPKKTYPLFRKKGAEIYTNIFGHYFSEYVSLAEKTGFRIEKILEPKISGKCARIAKKRGFSISDRPLCLVAKLRKLKR